MTNKINIKLLNYLIIALIIFILNETKDLWNLIIITLKETLKPLLIAIVISYICNLYLNKLNKIFKKKYLSILIFIFLIFIILYFIGFKILPLIIKQCIDFINIIIYFLNDLSKKHNINIVNLYDKIIYFKEIIPNIINLNLFSSILKHITFLLFIFILSIYFFLDFNKIIDLIKDKSNKYKCFYKYLKTLNNEIEKYFTSFFILIILNILLYMFIFFIVGHPNYIFLGLCAGILNIIPIFGGIITNILALITSFVINYGLFIRTLIGILILSILDSYIMSPLVYSKGNKLHPLAIVISLYIGSKFLGFFGTIFSIPLLIIIKVSYKFIKEKN